MDEGTTGDYLHIRGLPRMVTPCDTPREAHGEERSGELSPPWQKSGRVARAVRRQSVCKLALFNNMADKEESDSDIGEVLLLYIYNKRRKARRRAREYWVHDILLQRSQFGEYYYLVKQLFSYEHKFFQYFRMLPQTFNDLHEKLNNDLTKEATFWRKPIGTKERLAICLR